MKKILLGSVAFFLFAITVSILQTSCDKEANANTDAYVGLTQQSKIIYHKISQVNLATDEIWIANYDGTGQTKINIILPQGWQIGNGTDAKLSPDGKTVFFGAYDKPSNISHIYKCNIDGSNLTQVVYGSSSIQGAY